MLRLADVAGEALDYLVVLDMNDGLVSGDVQPVRSVASARGRPREIRNYIASSPLEFAVRDICRVTLGPSEAKNSGSPNLGNLRGGFEFEGEKNGEPLWGRPLPPPCL